MLLLIKRLFFNQMIWMNSLVSSFRTLFWWTVQTQLCKAIFCTGMLSTVPQLFRWLCLLCTVENVSFKKTLLLTWSKILQNTGEVFQSTECWRTIWKHFANIVFCMSPCFSSQQDELCNTAGVTATLHPVCRRRVCSLIEDLCDTVKIS